MKSTGLIIAEARKAKKMSQVELAKKLLDYGFSFKPGTISAWEKGSNQINAEVFLAMCRILEIQDIYTATFGSNPFNMFSELNDEGKEKALDYINVLVASGLYKKEEAVIIPFKRNLPLFDLPASAGTGSFLDGESYELMEVGAEVPATADFGIRVSGNSMTPRFLDKQIVWVQQTEQIHDGEFGIFFLDGQSYIKKLQDNTEGLYLISLNPDYPPIKVTSDSTFKTFGRVVG